MGSFALAITLLSVTFTGFAQQPANGGSPEKRSGFGRHGGLFGLGHFARELNLTEAQRQQIEQIAVRFEQSTAPFREQLRAAHNANTQVDGSFNEAQVRQAAQARAAAQVELEVAYARARSEVYNVLTAEQRAQLAQIKQQLEQRRQQGRRRRGGVPSGAQLGERANRSAEAV